MLKAASTLVVVQFVVRESRPLYCVFLLVLYLLKLFVNLVFRFRHKFVQSFVTDFYHVFFHSTGALMKKQVQIGVKSDDFFSHRNANHAQYRVSFLLWDTP